MRFLFFVLRMFLCLFTAGSRQREDAACCKPDVSSVGLRLREHDVYDWINGMMPTRNAVLTDP